MIDSVGRFQCLKEGLLLCVTNHKHYRRQIGSHGIESTRSR